MTIRASEACKLHPSANRLDKVLNSLIEVLFVLVWRSARHTLPQEVDRVDIIVLSEVLHHFVKDSASATITMDHHEFGQAFRLWLDMNLVQIVLIKNGPWLILVLPNGHVAYLQVASWVKTDLTEHT